MSADPVGMMAELLINMHTGWCCCKLDACWTGATQSSCRSFVTQSCMSAGVVLLYLPYLLVWCLTISRACWCDASLKAILSGVVPHYQPLQLVLCLVIGHAFWCCASLSAVTAGAVPRYRPCLPGASLLAVTAGAVPHYRSCLLVWCFTISHALV